MKPIHFLAVILAATLFLLWQLFDPFLKAITVALLLAIATNSIKIFIEFKVHNKLITTIMMTFLLGILFFAPISYFITQIVHFMNSIDQNSLINIFDEIKIFVSRISDDFIFIKGQLQNLLDSIDIQLFITQVFSAGTYIGKNSATFVVDMVLILVFYTFFIYYGKELTFYIKDILPLKKEDSNELFLEVSNVMGVVFYSVIINAVLQGLLFGLFINSFEYDGILLGILYGFASLIPVIGGAIMWVPIALIEILSGDPTNAIYIVLYSIIIISVIADTFIKPMVITYINHKVVQTPTIVNEILIFFSIIAGLSTFGFWGMIIGPAAVAFFISLMYIIKKHHLLDG